MPSQAQKDATKRWREKNREEYDAKQKIYLKDYMREYMKSRYNYDDNEKLKKQKYYIYKKETEKFRLILIDF